MAYGQIGQPGEPLVAMCFPDGRSGGTGEPLSLCQWYADSVFLSDARLKANVAPIMDPLRTIGQLQGVTYQWRPDVFPPHADPGILPPAGATEMGFLAQELEQVLPDTVTTDVGEDGSGDGYKHVDYIQYIALLTEGIKALDAKVVALDKAQEDIHEGPPSLGWIAAAAGIFAAVTLGIYGMAWKAFSSFHNRNHKDHHPATSAPNHVDKANLAESVVSAVSSTTDDGETSDA